MHAWYPHGCGAHQALISGWNITDAVVSGSGVIDGRGLTDDPVLQSSWASRFKALYACKPPRGKGYGAAAVVILLLLLLLLL